MKINSFFSCLSLAAILLAGGGCSFKKITVNTVARALSGDESLVFNGEDDPELVGAALPFALKTYESLLEASPRNPRLLAAAGKVFVMYSFAFVQSPAEMMTEDHLARQKHELQRAKKLYLRGRDYLLAALNEAHPGFAGLVRQGRTDSALVSTTIKDTTLLYWTGMAWMGALNVDKNDIGLVVTMPQAIAFLSRVSELKETYGEGAIHEFFLSYYGGLPASMGGSEEKSRRHFARAVELSKGKKAGPYVALATTVCVRNQNLAEFRDLLHKALAVDVTRKDRYRLTNVIYQEKAGWLLDHADRFFVNDTLGEY
jgi:predicted anti-sigma-YlaC factor YlaD